MTATETVARTERFDASAFDHEQAVGLAGEGLRENHDVETIDAVDVDRTGTGQWVVRVTATLAMGDGR